MNEAMLKFLDIWHWLMYAGSVICLLTGLLIPVYLRIRTLSLADYKDRYDFIRLKEMKSLEYAVLCISIAVGLFINTTYRSTIVQSSVWFFVRFFISFAITTLIAYISLLFLRNVYPATLERKLKRLRYKPRTSPQTGKKMKLLSEDEEDVHLEEGMLAEQNAFSVDYDVWVDQETGYIKIEKYPGYLQVLKCKSCGFYTMKFQREEILIQPTEFSEGELMKYYECSFCHKKRHIDSKIAKLTVDNKYSLPEHYHFKEEKKVQVVRVEIMDSLGGKEAFEFSNLEKAKKFIDEYELEPVD